MIKTTYQTPELRDANDNIIQAGTYGKESPLVNSDNTGVLDYINNNLEALYDAQTAATLITGAGRASKHPSFRSLRSAPLR